MAADQFIEWEAVTRELREHINSHSAAQKALVTLLKVGCEESILLKHLYAYCGGNPETAKAIKNEFGWRKRQMTKLSHDLARLAEQIEHAAPVLEDFGVTCHFTPNLNEMRAYGEFLSRLANTQLRYLADKRVSGRDHHLVYLCEWVKLIAGRPHYNEIAELVSATTSLYQPNIKKNVVYEDIRKVVSHYGMLDVEGKLELAKWASSRRGIKNNPL